MTAPLPVARAVRAARRAAGAPRFSGWSSLVTRILVVNLLALLVLAGGLFYIEGFRARLLETREQELLQQGKIVAQFLENQGIPQGSAAIAGISSPRGTRIRLYDATGQLVADNWTSPLATRFVLEDPTTEGFRRESAIIIDRITDFLTGQSELSLLEDPAQDSRAAWPEVVAASHSGQAHTRARQTADRLVVLQAAVPIGEGQPGQPVPVVLLTVDTPDVIDLVRRERMTSFLVFLGVLGFSLALSFFLARTIVVPLRQLARAAHRVRLGRARDVVVPRLPHRRDEVGGLARALADMTVALRHRIDATEAFAADVAHELKNPLASLRSAVEALGSIRDEGARAQLFAVINADVRRIDRLISDISAASRLEAELSRARLQPVDLGLLVRNLVAAQTATGPLPARVRLVVDAPSDGTAMVTADADRLAQIINNLLDNGLSFSPEGGTLMVRVRRAGHVVELQVMDEGPGVPPEARDAIFGRFYSERPGHENYGQHSGLGLSIAKAIVEALDGHIRVDDRADGRAGAVFSVTFPAI